jgi:hypothetical protein
MNLVHVAVTLVIRILGLDVEYLGLVEELEVEAEHLLVLRVLGIVSLGWSHGREICRVVLVLWKFCVLYIAARSLKLWWLSRCLLQ